MLSLNFQHILDARAVSNPSKFLKKAGFSRHTTAKLLGNDMPHPRLEHIERLCRVLHCTPNDILSWKADKDASLNAEHPLHQLAVKERQSGLLKKLKTLPLDKLAEIEKLIDDSNSQ